MLHQNAPRNSASSCRSSVSKQQSTWESYIGKSTAYITSYMSPGACESRESDLLSDEILSHILTLIFLCSIPRGHMAASRNLTMAKSVSITHGGDSECTHHHKEQTNMNIDMLSSVAALNGRVFSTDPVISYMLLDLPRKDRLSYLPTYWETLIKSALLNDAIITEANGWKAASVLLPPGRYVDNAWTLVCAGFLGVLWRIGFPGFKVWSSLVFGLHM